MVGSFGKSLVMTKTGSYYKLINNGSCNVDATVALLSELHNISLLK